MDKLHQVSERYPTVQSCCCCVNLRSAGLALGILCVFGSFWPTPYIFIILLPGHICWFAGILMVWRNTNKCILNSNPIMISSFDISLFYCLQLQDKPKLLLIGIVSHASVYVLMISCAVYLGLRLHYGTAAAIFAGFFDFCKFHAISQSFLNAIRFIVVKFISGVAIYFLTVEFSLYKSMNRPATNATVL